MEGEAACEAPATIISQTSKSHLEKSKLTSCRPLPRSGYDESRFFIQTLLVIKEISCHVSCCTSGIQKLVLPHSSQYCQRTPRSCLIKHQLSIQLILHLRSTNMRLPYPGYLRLTMHLYEGAHTPTEQSSNESQGNTGIHLLRK